MRTILRRHLGKLVAGTAVALTGSAVAVAVTLPGAAGAGERDVKTAARQAPLPGVVEAAPSEGDKGVGTDPLTTAETERAEKAALSGEARLAARDVEGDRGPQHLSTDLSEPDPADGDDTARRAEILYYDYKTDELIAKTVNLTTGKVETTEAERGIQPPAVAAERAEAAELLMADPLGADLKRDYEDATGNALTSAGQLHLNAFVFRKETVEQVPPALSKCGEHRCIRLVAKVVNGPWIDIRNLVIDLSDRKVTRLP
ncbi:Tat pathway signal sequence domain protein [Streptomyces monticola]|uniref:Tat pathway signal sequence domain protein n=1 Tax=Streptomyces monticola TaxID=2666263 RepID=A0ABW2JBJ7_9ACTN